MKAWATSIAAEITSTHAKKNMVRTVAVTDRIIAATPSNDRAMPKAKYHPQLRIMVWEISGSSFWRSMTALIVEAPWWRYSRFGFSLVFVLAGTWLRAIITAFLSLRNRQLPNVRSKLLAMGRRVKH